MSPARRRQWTENQPHLREGDDGVFAWDNVLYTTMPHLDNLGLLFDAGGQEINIYPGAHANGAILAGSSNNFGGDAGTFNLTAVPEPATWEMMLLGAGMIGSGQRMTRRRGGTASV